MMRVVGEIMPDGSRDENLPSFQDDESEKRVGKIVKAFHFQNVAFDYRADQFKKIWDFINNKENRPGEPFADHMMEEVNVTVEFASEFLVPVIRSFARKVREELLVIDHAKAEAMSKTVFLDIIAKRSIIGRTARESQAAEDSVSNLKEEWIDCSQLVYLRKVADHDEGEVFERIAHYSPDVATAGGVCITPLPR